MGRSRPAPEVTPTALVASAVRISTAKDYGRLSRLGTAWQEEAWEFYDSVGEFRFVCDWVGNMLSKAIIRASVTVDGTREDVTEGPAAEIVAEMFGDDEDTAEILRNMGIHFTVAGECFVVGTVRDRVGAWEVVASTELRGRRNGEKIIWTIDGEKIESDTDPLVIRLWRPHPKKKRLAHSPTRAMLPILAEIVKLTQHVDAQVDSRLAGAGILLMPSEMTFPPPQDAQGQTTIQVNSAQGLMEVLQEVMATSLRDRGDASARVPIVITAPADAIAAVKHLTFWSELDRQAVELRNEAIRRLALGMDIAPEVLTGVAEANHWSAWQADESAIKAHTEPLLKIITHSMTVGFLRPALTELQDLEHPPERYGLTVDTSEMRVRPNRSKEALEIYDRGELSGKALLRETGFEPEDAMDDTERALWFTRKVASGSTTPELVHAALVALGVKIPAPSADAPMQEAPSAPSLLEHPARDIPDREDGERRAERRAERQVNPALTAAAEQVVLRAMERAGNRLKNRFQTKPPGVAASGLYLFTPVSTGDLDTLLEDAWGNVPALADRYGADPDRLTHSLDFYCRGLFLSQATHEFDRFEDYLDRVLTPERALA